MKRSERGESSQAYKEAVRKIVTKYVSASGITKRISPHSLRHTFATQKAEKGVSTYQLQKWLGHANLNTTQISVHPSKQSGGQGDGADDFIELSHARM